VKIGAAGICRSDLHFLKGEAMYPFLPAIPGHEGSGAVEAVGEGVSMVKPGDRVILSFVPGCGHCHFCETGRPNLCETHALTPGLMLDGTSRLATKDGQRISNMGKVSCFAEYSVVPESGCIPVGDDFPFENAALVGCSVTTGVGAALYTAKVTPGSSVVVVGSGGVGLNVIQGARIAGAAKIVALDVIDERLEFALTFGATHTVNANDEDCMQRVREITNGGADFGFEVFGSARTTEMAIDLTRKGGTTVVVGLAPVGDKASIDATALVRQERTIKGSYYGSARPRQDMPVIVDLYRRKALDIDRLTTRRYSLDQINEAFDELEKGTVGRGVIVF
jgi:S-(hydroxymethyl)glutathione dehydrogenase/alcohol dehydrogenase